MDAISIRQETLGDIDQMAQLYSDLFDQLEAGPNYPGWRRGVYPLREDALEGIQAGTLYLAQLGKNIAGSVILNQLAPAAYEGAAWQHPENAALVVHTFVVHPAFRGMGIGQALLSFADEHAKNLGLGCVRLDVFEGNLPAIALYRRCGYSYIQRVDLGLGEYGLDWFELYGKAL